MSKVLYIHREGTVSVAQLPHEDGGFIHVLATPTRNGVLYYVGHRPNRRTKKMRILAGGFRSVSKAFQKLYSELKKAKLPTQPWDPMGTKVQRWEQEFVDPQFAPERLTKDQMIALFYRVCGERKVHAPQVVFVKNANFCYFKRCENSIAYVVMSENPTMCNTAFVLHELAHFLADLKSPDIDNHGPLFMREYLGLLRDFTNLDLELLQEGCRKHQVKYWKP